MKFQAIKMLAISLCVLSTFSCAEKEQPSLNALKADAKASSYINKKAIATMQSYDDYTFQVEQKTRHKKGQYLKSGEWFDGQGSLGITAGLERVTGNIEVKRISN